MRMKLLAVAAVVFLAGTLVGVPAAADTPLATPGTPVATQVTPFGRSLVSTTLRDVPGPNAVTTMS